MGVPVGGPSWGSTPNIPIERILVGSGLNGLWEHGIFSDVELDDGDSLPVRCNHGIDSCHNHLVVIDDSHAQRAVGRP